MMEMIVFAKDGIEVKVLPRTKPPMLEPIEPIYEAEITGESEAQKRNNRDIRNQEKQTSHLGK